MSEQFLIGKIVKNYRSLYVNNKKIFFVCVYKIFNITKKIIEKNIEEKLGHKNLPVISNKYNKIYKKHRCELVDKPIKQSDRRFLHIDLALKLIIDCRTDKSCSLKKT